MVIIILLPTVLLILAKGSLFVTLVGAIATFAPGLADYISSLLEKTKLNKLKMIVGRVKLIRGIIQMLALLLDILSMATFSRCKWKR